MVRRTAPRAETERNAWPVVVRVLVPEQGLGQLHNLIYCWLGENLGKGQFWQGPHSCALGASIAFHFRMVEHASEFVARFPELVLADGTLANSYSSPELPFGREEVSEMCTLYNLTTAQEAMRQLFQGIEFHDRAGNLPEQPEIYPDYLAPIIRHASDGLELVKARWGLPTPPQFLVGKKTDRGVTNVRNTASLHWRRWLGPEFRCLVPVNRFAEPDTINGGNVWFALPDDRLAFFAGIQVPGWTSTRRLKDGETTDDLFAFLTCNPNSEVRAVHPKAMPVLLTTAAEWSAWMSAPWQEAAGQQKPLPDGSLVMVDKALLQS